jgi:hypothetical protein
VTKRGHAAVGLGNSWLQSDFCGKSTYRDSQNCENRSYTQLNSKEYDH